MQELKIQQEAILGNNKRVNILNAVIDHLNMCETVSLTEKYIQKKLPLHLVGVNADKINQMKKNDYLQKIVNSCGIVNADGASVIMASRFLGNPLPERVAGIDLMQELIRLSDKSGHRVFLLGAEQDVVVKTAEVLKKKYKNLIISGIHNGFFSEEEWPRISNEIKKANPDLVFVGITSPIKEYLVEYLQNDGNVCVFVGVGGSFDVISGKIPRAPEWMQKINLEWLFRVIREPRRLFKRYFVGNISFICKIFKEKRKRL